MRLFYFVAFVAMLASSAVAEDIAVTVYNNNLGVVSEIRTLEFNRGINRLEFTDVPSGIDPASVRFEVLGGGDVSILEQNYAYDLVGTQQLYTKYLGREIELVSLPKAYVKHIGKEIELVDKDGEVYSGTLLSNDRNTAIIIQEKSGGVKIVHLTHIVNVNFPSLPEGLITRPTLFWVYNSDTEGKLDTRVGYQTTGLNWKAEYVAVLDSVEKKIAWSGWSSIDNNSGKTFKEATLKLVAGEIHRTPTPTQKVRGSRDMLQIREIASMTVFEEKPFFEYHLYTLPRKATLADKEKKQISLFEPASADVEKVFMFRPDRDAQQVEVSLKFSNSQAAGLGMPLPAGRARVFKADSDGSLILLGEDWIKHTPKDEEVNLQIGKAFDITADAAIVAQKKKSDSVEEKDYEIRLSNRKDEGITVKVEKILTGYWDMVESSMEYEKKDAVTIHFNVSLKPGETVSVKFKVRHYLH